MKGKKRATRKKPKTELVKTKGLVVRKETLPAEIIKAAVTSGADLDKLEKVLALQMQWEANEAKKAYHKAMADFKADAPETILKTTKIDYTTKAGSRVKYSHATLANIVKAITQGLSKHGLSVSWPPKQESGSITVFCKITHELGHSESFALTAQADDTGSKNKIQALGSTVSYLQRYTLLAATGLATEDQDDDAKAADLEKITKKNLENLRKQMKELGVEKQENKFLEFLNIKKLEDLPESDLKKAQSALDAKRETKK